MSFIDKERLEQINMMLETLEQVKIVDAQVLCKLYELYRCKPEN